MIRTNGVAAADSSRISPTAHYTAEVWLRHGMSHPALATPLGARLHLALSPLNAWYARFSRRPSLDMMLLARHRVLDHLLEQAIAAGARQVVEIAAGLSARGYRFARRHPEVTYVETDLADMAAKKRAALRAAGVPLGPRHRVEVLDALSDDGPNSLAQLASTLDPARGLVIITEGLLGYFDRDTVEGMWRRFARVLAGFSPGVYLSDLNLAGDLGGMRTARVFKFVLSRYARGQVHLHYEQPAEVEAAMRAAGLPSPSVRVPTDFPEVDFPGRDRQHVVRLLSAGLGDAVSL